MDKKKILVGAHTSIAGGVENALYRGQEIGATTVQIFTANQRQWNARPLKHENIKAWFEAKQKTQIDIVTSHGSYLVNLGSPKKDVHEKSLEVFKEEIQRCQALEINFLNFHPGAALHESEEACLDHIIHSLLKMEPYLQKGSLRLLLETTAGQGSQVGYRFEHLKYILDQTERHIPIGVCIDTCHIFAAGYDLSTKDATLNTLKTFDKVIGLDNLYAFHFNDSKFKCGEKKDRHMHLGEGFIGLDGFKTLMTHPKTCNVPKYLETPLGPSRWESEIELLKSFTQNTYAR
ncbi:MAG: Endonuclease 4 [Chlamydiae bacterium]|nr:Endonuclease 4 [Chlamydiota bacterium]